jgi:hypothetical protein
MGNAFSLRPAPLHFVQPDFQAIETLPAIASFDQAQFPNAGYPCKNI